MATSSNVIFYHIFDWAGNHKAKIRHNVMCRFPIEKFEDFKPREDFQYFVSGEDEDEVEFKTGFHKLSDLSILKLEDTRNKNNYGQN